MHILLCSMKFSITLPPMLCRWYGARIANIKMIVGTVIILDITEFCSQPIHLTFAATARERAEVKTMIELKPCPFCGERQSFFVNANRTIRI